MTGSIVDPRMPVQRTQQAGDVIVRGAPARMQSGRPLAVDRMRPTSLNSGSRHGESADSAGG
jgi:hypothetical protein